MSTLLAILQILNSGSQDDRRLMQVQALVARPDAMCGVFVQQKTLVGLRLPVRASGRFCVVAAHGVLWSIQRPFPSTLLLTRAEIVESQGGRVTSRISASEEPAVGVISELLFSVLAGDLKKLQGAFAIAASVETTTWSARLIPKGADMRRAISVIELSGAEFVRQITITESSGDRTAISFADFVTGTSALTPDEMRAFGPRAGVGKARP